VSNDPHIYPGDVHRDTPIRRRSEEEVERELRVDHTSAPSRDPTVAGAEGGDQSPSTNVPPGTPADDRAPAGDTDQHSDDDKVR
jgi:hypothetical protein